MYIPTPIFQKCGLTFPEIGRIRVLLNTWHKCCGSEWVVERLKMYKMWYLNKIGGNTYDIPWYKIRNGQVIGPLAPLFRCKNHKLVISALSTMYTSLRHRKVSRKQARKFFQSVTRNPGPSPFIPFLNEAHDEFLNRKESEFKRYTYTSYPFSGEKSVCGHNGKSIKNSPVALIDDFSCSGVWDYLDNDECQGVISETLDKLYPVLFHESVETWTDDYVGKISVIQERGCKARFIAVPKLVHQVSLMSLGKYLFSCLRECPWDCTFDQMKGVRWAHAHLDSHNKIWSVDISDATNNTPLRQIVRILKRDGDIPVGDIEYFSRVSTGKYFLPEVLREGYKFSKAQAKNSEIPKGINVLGDKHRMNAIPLHEHTLEEDVDTDESCFIQWSQGQPLGTYPSFPAFALWHGLVLRSIELRYGLSDTFRVLGDDVIISSGLVYFSYRRLMESMEVPISEGKSLIGIGSGEFGGYVITKSGPPFRASKYTFPTHNNVLYRVYEGLKGIGDIKSPMDLIAYSLLSPLSSNSEGVPLRLRAAFNLILHNSLEDSIILRNKLSDPVYNRICMHYFGLDADQNIYHRDEFEIPFTPIYSLFRDDLKSVDQSLPARALTSFDIANACGIYEMRVLKGFFTKHIQNCPKDWITLCYDIKDTLFTKPSHPLYKVLLSRALKNQILSFTKSKETVKGELLDIMLQILEQS